MSSPKVFINLPVKDLEKSKAFYQTLGYTINPQFTDKTGACVVISEDIYSMLLTYDKYNYFVKKDIADANKTSEVINALSTDSREKVDQMMEKVFAAGGKEIRNPEDYGWMYGRAYEDPDGHIWEIFWMDPSHVKESK